MAGKRTHVYVEGRGVVEKVREIQPIEILSGEMYRFGIDLARKELDRRLKPVRGGRIVEVKR